MFNVVPFGARGARIVVTPGWFKASRYFFNSMIYLYGQSAVKEWNTNVKRTRRGWLTEGGGEGRQMYFEILNFE